MYQNSSKKRYKSNKIIQKLTITRNYFSEIVPKNCPGNTGVCLCRKTLLREFKCDRSFEKHVRLPKIPVYCLASSQSWCAYGLLLNWTLYLIGWCNRDSWVISQSVDKEIGRVLWNDISNAASLRDVLSVCKRLSDNYLFV